MANVTVRLNIEEEKILRGYAEMVGSPLSTLMKETLLNLVEDQYDVNLLEKAIEENKNDLGISHEEMKKELGL